MNIILSGFMGSGKSTLAKLLAEKLDMYYLDLDEFIEKKCGMNVTEIFQTKGEGEFRRLEEEAAKEVGTYDNYVIATGGGTILNSNNVKSLKANGKIVFLDVTVDTVIRRLANDDTRPLLQTSDKENAVSVMLEGRLPIYQAAADITFDANSDDTNKKVADLIKKL